MQPCCERRCHARDEVRIEVLRNRRPYGAYRFAARAAALTFAARLRQTFESNGWVAA